MQKQIISNVVPAKCEKKQKIHGWYVTQIEHIHSCTPWLQWKKKVAVKSLYCEGNALMWIGFVILEIYKDAK